MKYYTGVGSRETPDHITTIIHSIAEQLAVQKIVLRSGGATGADTAFEDGCDLANGPKEIYLPRKGFNNHQSTLYESSPEAYILAKKFYTVGTLNLDIGHYNSRSKAINQFMARNVHQVLGQDLKTPSLFVVCWTADGCERGDRRSKDTGGTGQAITVADHHQIPVFNLSNNLSLQLLSEHLEDIGLPIKLI